MGYTKESMKNFSQWFPVKSKLDESSHKPPFVSEGDIWCKAYWLSVSDCKEGKVRIYPDGVAELL